MHLSLSRLKKVENFLKKGSGLEYTAPVRIVQQNPNLLHCTATKRSISFTFFVHLFVGIAQYNFFIRETENPENFHRLPSRPLVLGASRIRNWSGHARGGERKKGKEWRWGFVCFPPLFACQIACFPIRKKRRRREEEEEKSGSCRIRPFLWKFFLFLTDWCDFMMHHFPFFFRTQCSSAPYAERFPYSQNFTSFPNANFWLSRFGGRCVLWRCLLKVWPLETPSFQSLKRNSILKRILSPLVLPVQIGAKLHLFFCDRSLLGISTNNQPTNLPDKSRAIVACFFTEVRVWGANETILHGQSAIFAEVSDDSPFRIFYKNCVWLISGLYTGTS